MNHLKIEKQSIKKKKKKKNVGVTTLYMHRMKWDYICWRLHSSVTKLLAFLKINMSDKGKGKCKNKRNELNKYIYTCIHLLGIN